MDDSHIVQFEKARLKDSSSFSGSPFHYSMDMEFLNSEGLFIVSEWPENENSGPKISTWKWNGWSVEKIGSSELPDRGDVPYSPSSQCGVKLAYSKAYLSSIFITRCMSNTSVSLESYSLDESGVLLPETRQTLIHFDTRNHWGSYEHLVGEMDFGSDGMLWIFMGYGNMDNTSQDPMSPFGSILRVSVNESSISPADGNPFEINSGWDSMVYANGLRMPWTAAQDESGNWWVGDVGEAQFERIQLVDRPGINFGYYKHRWIEPGDGNCTYCDNFQSDFLNYSRELDHRFMVEDTESFESYYAANWVGVQLPDSEFIPEDFVGGIVFGDFTRGFIRVINNDGSANSTHIGHLVGVVDVEVLNGEVFFLTTGVQISSEVREAGFWKLVF